MSVWRSVEEVMRDLSVAQGFVVPAPLKTFTGDGPPPYEVEEDSIEQSFYTSEGGGSGHFPAPNYKLIQNMLNMVHKDDQEETGAHSIDVDPAGNHIEEKAKAADLSARRPMSPSDIRSMFKRKSSTNSEQAYNPRNGSVSSPPTSDKSKQYKPSANASAYYSKYLEKSNLREHLEEDLWTKLEREMKELEEKKKRKAELKTPKELGNVSPGDASDLFGEDTPECGFCKENLDSKGALELEMQRRNKEFPDRRQRRDGVEFTVFELSLAEHRHVLPGDCVVCVVAAKHGFYF